MRADVGAMPTFQLLARAERYLTLALKAQRDGRTDEAQELTQWTVHCLQDAVSIEKLRLSRGTAHRFSPSSIQTTVTTILDAWCRADPLREPIGSSYSPPNAGNEKAIGCIAKERGARCMTSSEDYRRYARECLEPISKLRRAVDPL
jgi:hypothetical protein